MVAPFQRFPDNATAEQWFVETRWPSGVQCPACASDNVQARPTRKPQPYRCRSCRTDFSAKTGTLMQGSNLGFQTWVIALYLLTTGLKGTSSMKLHRDLGVTQKTAWHLAHRIRETWAAHAAAFDGPVELDEAYLGGKEDHEARAGPSAQTAIRGQRVKAGTRATAQDHAHTDSGDAG